jgi:hypothetical protein
MAELTATKQTRSALYWTNQKVLAWCGPAYVLAIVVGLVLVAGFIPPPRPSLSAHQIAQVYAQNPTGIRIGLFIAISGTALYAPFAAAISAQMLRQEDRRRPVLAYVQLINGGLGSLVLMLAFMFMMVAAFDPGRPAEITKVINELGWIFLVIPFPPFCIQYVAIALAIFQDPSARPLFPRWVAYYNIWIAVAFLPTGLVGFFHHGPFAWNGAISFWLAVAVYAGWLLVMTWALLRSIREEQAAVVPVSGIVAGA